jgi:hypothetical protein
MLGKVESSVSSMAQLVSSCFFPWTQSEGGVVADWQYACYDLASEWIPQGHIPYSMMLVNVVQYLARAWQEYHIEHLGSLGNI